MRIFFVFLFSIIAMWAFSASGPASAKETNNRQAIHSVDTHSK